MFSESFEKMLPAKKLELSLDIVGKKYDTHGLFLGRPTAGGGFVRPKAVVSEAFREKIHQQLSPRKNPCGA